MTEIPSSTLETQRWQAIQRRELNGLAPFFYGVLTTGIYCRPTCPSKQPKREHARFFANQQEARQAGFRPCKRCKPDEDTDELLRMVEQACESIRRSPSEASLKELADEAGFSPSHFHRLFKRLVGVTPKQYALQQQHRRLSESLRTRNSVTEAVVHEGGSIQRLYGSQRQRLGMPPRQYQMGGTGNRIRYALATCELGWVILAATEEGVCAIEFGDHRTELEDRLKKTFPNALEVSQDPQLSAWLSELLNSLGTPAGAPQLPLDIRGSAFQMRVWQAIRRIPAGETASYSEIARQIGSPGAARAVARACAGNPTAVVIPCHRVVKSDGSLGGYRWGVARKKRLLELERKSEDKAD